jgi:ankyrin repeat protein
MLDRIRDGRTDLVLDLLAGGHEPTTTVDGVALIRWCAYHGDVSAVKILLEHGESLSTLGPNLDLNGAAFHGHWQLCEFLLESGADANHALPDTGETPLHAALCKRDQPEFERVVRVLLASGADPNRPARAGAETGAFMRDVRTRGETPLHRAAAFGSEGCIRMLLDAGADPRLRDAHGDSPLSWASWHLRPRPILRLLATDGVVL